MPSRAGAASRPRFLIPARIADSSCAETELTHPGTRYGTLTSAVTLSTHLCDPDWIVVDCRFDLADPAAGREAYAAGHIAGARYADLGEDLAGPVTSASGRHPLPAPATLARTLGGWGIGVLLLLIAAVCVNLMGRRVGARSVS